MSPDDMTEYPNPGDRKSVGAPSTRRIWSIPIRLIRRRVGAASGLLFDKFYGVDTAGEAPTRRLRMVGHPVIRHVDFMSVPPRTFHRVMKTVPAMVDMLTF